MTLQPIYYFFPPSSPSSEWFKKTFSIHPSCGRSLIRNRCIKNGFKLFVGKYTRNNSTNQQVQANTRKRLGTLRKLWAYQVDTLSSIMHIPWITNFLEANIFRLVSKPGLYEHSFSLSACENRLWIQACYGRCMQCVAQRERQWRQKSKRESGSTKYSFVHVVIICSRSVSMWIEKKVSKSQFRDNKKVIWNVNSFPGRLG